MIWKIRIPSSYKLILLYINIIRSVILLLLFTKFKAVFSRCEDIAKDRNTRDHLAWTAGNEDLTQNTSRMGTARVKEEEETDTRIIEKYERKERGHEEEKTQTRPS